MDPYSARARALLTSKRVAFEERPLPKHMSDMLQLTGSTEAPQIVINGVAVGGYEKLSSLELRGELDKLLRS